MSDAAAVLSRLDAIPSQLKGLPRWVPWQYRSTASGKAIGKVPLAVAGDGSLVPADAHNPANHLSFDAAIEIARRHPGTGLGFDIVEGDGIEGLDADDCIDASGTVHPEVQQLVELADSYVERSPSARGIRIFGFNEPLGPGDRKLSETKSGIGLERYTRRRFLTVTGDVVIAKPLSDLSALRDVLDASYFRKRESTPRAAPLSDDTDFDIAVAMVSLQLLSDARADGYTGWFKAGACCADIGDAMRDAFHAFSRRSVKYDAAECEEKWQHLLGRDGRRELGHAVGTLMAMAAEDTGKSTPDILRLAEERLGRPRNGSETITIIGIGGKSAPTPDPDIETLAIPAADAFGYRPFPTDSLPPELRDYVAEISEALVADEGAVANPMLAVLATAVGTTRQVEVKRSWRAYPMLWSGSVAESGDLKSPIFDAVLRPVERMQDELMAEYAEARREFEEQAIEHQRQLAEWKKSRGSTPVPVPPEKPVPRRIWTADTTVEAAAVLLADPRSRGIVIVSDELVGWLGSFDRYKGGKGDEGFYLSAHGGKSFIADRKTGDRPVIHVRRAAISIIGGIQPARAIAELGPARRSSGLVPRFIVAMPPRRPVEWSEAEPSVLTTDCYERIVRQLYALEHATDEAGESHPILVRLSPEAKAAFVEWHREHKRHARQLVGDVRAAMSKLLELPARLGLVLHEVAVATKRHTLPADEMAVEAMAAAVTISRWYRHEVERLYRMLESTPAEAKAAATRDAIAATIVEELWERGQLSRREIREAVGTAGTSTDIVHALADLLARGDVVQEPEAGSDAWRPTPRQRGASGTGGFKL
jgi:hypothetical protein